MKIAIDCRYLGKSGIGRVCEGIIDHLDYQSDTFYLIGNKEKLQNYPQAIIVDNRTDPYSIKGLRNFNQSLINRECEAIIIPNFLVPFGIKKPVFSIMHDLIFLDLKISTRGKIDYIIKKKLLTRGMRKSKAVACVSEFTRSRCEHHFPKFSEKCYVNYIGLSKNILDYAERHRDNPKEKKIIYVGNVKPHKGLKTLIEAYDRISRKDICLKIIGEKDNFLTKDHSNIFDRDDILFTGKISDEELYHEIATSSYLIQPSVYEGFGLPPLEALYLGTQPIISNISVFREIYSGLPVIFFKDKDDLSEKLCAVAQRILCREQLKKFSYKNFNENLMQKIYQSRD